MNSTNTLDDARYVKAMSHPLRVTIMAMLEERAASPVELARNLDASLGTVAYHVRTLHRLGLIDLVDETPVRGSIQHHYRVRQRPHDLRRGMGGGAAHRTAGGRALRRCNSSTSTSAYPPSPAASTAPRPISLAPASRWTARAGRLRPRPAPGCWTSSTASRRQPPSAWRATRTPKRSSTPGIVTMFFEAARLSQTGTARRDGAAAAPAHADGASAAQH